MLMAAVRREAEDTRQLEDAARRTHQDIPRGNAPPTPTASSAPYRLTHRRVLCYYIPLCVAAAATVFLSLAAATVPMSTTHAEYTRPHNALFYLESTSQSAADFVEHVCTHESPYVPMASASFLSMVQRSLREPDDTAFSIGAPYEIANCTVYTAAEWSWSQHSNVGVNPMEGPLITNPLAYVVVIERKGLYDTLSQAREFILVQTIPPSSRDDNRTTTFNMFFYVSVDYETYNTFVKPVGVNRRRVVTSPISTWHSLAELTTMIALAISGCIFAFAWGQVKELDALQELEQTTNNAVVLSPSDQYSVLGTAFGSSEELLEDPYGTAIYTKGARYGDQETTDGATHSHRHSSTGVDDLSDYLSPQEDQPSPLDSPTAAAPADACRPASPPPQDSPTQRELTRGDAPQSATIDSTTGVRIHVDTCDDAMPDQDPRHHDRDATENVESAAVQGHEPSSPTLVRAIPISRTRITRMRRLRDLIRQYQLARVRQLAFLDCVLLIVSFFLFLNTFASSSHESVTRYPYPVRTITAQATYMRLRVGCCALSLVTLLTIAAIVKNEIW